MAEEGAIDERLLARLAEISALEPTIDVAKRDSYTTANGWNIDAREVVLPLEPPGEPVTNGSYAAACRILFDYAFPPARLIRGRFNPQAPLAERTMLLTAQYLWMTFELPVRVTRVLDETRETKAGAERRWGYSYQTLAGHLERGEITFEIAKLLDTGAVHFRISSFSQTGHIANLVHRVGFRIVGRRLQRRFAEESLRNMHALVVAALARQHAATGAPAETQA